MWRGTGEQHPSYVNARNVSVPPFSCLYISLKYLLVHNSEAESDCTLLVLNVLQHVRESVCKLSDVSYTSKTWHQTGHLCTQCVVHVCCQR